jgi:hypothetical protein
MVLKQGVGEEKMVASAVQMAIRSTSGQSRILFYSFRMAKKMKLRRMGVSSLSGQKWAADLWVCKTHQAELLRKPKGQISSIQQKSRRLPATSAGVELEEGFGNLW